VKKWKASNVDALVREVHRASGELSDNIVGSYFAAVQLGYEGHQRQWDTKVREAQDSSTCGDDEIEQWLGNG
jgi:hypothetical protein